MSAGLRLYAQSQATMLANLKRQLLHSVPEIPHGVSLAGKTVLVTGSNTGLGLESARHFLRMGAERLVMGVRSVERGDAAAAGLRAQFPKARVDVWQLDMASGRSVQDFAARCDADLARLDVAVLNAALAKIDFTRVGGGDGRETMLVVNYIHTALLSILLLPLLRRSAAAAPGGSSSPSRLTIVSSDMALNTPLAAAKGPDGKALGILESHDSPNEWDGLVQYGRTKVLLMLFTARLAEVVSPDEVVINCSNPGATKDSEFMRESAGLGLATRVVLNILFGIAGRKAVDASRIYAFSAVVLGKESHGSFTQWVIRPWPPMLYTDEGQQLKEKLWDETMAELGFADVAGILEGMKR